MQVMEGFDEFKGLHGKENSEPKRLRQCFECSTPCHRPLCHKSRGDKKIGNALVKSGPTLFIWYLVLNGRGAWSLGEATKQIVEPPL